MPSSILNQLIESGVFRDFPQDAKEKLAKISITKTCSDGQVIYQNGDASDALYGVLTGGVKISAEDANGKYYLYGVSQPGLWFGEISALDGQPRAQTAIASGQTSLLKVPRNGLLELLDNEPILYKYFMKVFCRRLRHAGQILEESAFLPVSKRIAKQLLRQHKITQRHNVKLNQEELAASLGVTRQSVHRVLKDWQLNQWISVSYGNVEVLKVDALETFLDLSGE
ncbi:Crp/Fnr family transcriptional regulator [Oceaniserpentilla sp. 4NH20-0058]|uniref:Crp/Fnr family transcriptional regulator n=1 Tax=Oceaniserpentilla sp. 4NH20-0058 TaxID=3127660 RepID=UPI003109F12E